MVRDGLIYFSKIILALAACLALVFTLFSGCTNGIKGKSNQRESHEESVEKPSVSVKSPEFQITESPRPNIVLITLDAVRPDHLGCYGYFRPTSPNIDKLAKISTVFERAYSHAPWTLASVSSLFASQEPGAIPIVDWESQCPSTIQSLAEVLSKNGYFTYGCVSLHLLGASSGLEQGFEVFDESVYMSVNPFNEKSSKKVTDSGLKALEMRGNHPLFLWLHYYDPHDEYLDHKEINFGTKPIDLYDEEIAYTDYHIRRLLKGIKQKGMMKNTIIVIHSDHGEEFQEHDGAHHSATLYEEVMRVPLLIYVPNFKPQRPTAPVPLIDLAPTLLTLVGLPIPESYRGIALPVVQNRFQPQADRPIFFENTCNGLCQKAILAGNLKLISDCNRNRFYQVYDLASDPREQEDLYSEFPDTDSKGLGPKFEILKKKLDDHFSKRQSKETTRKLSKQEIDTLKSVGYMN